MYSQTERQCFEQFRHVSEEIFQTVFWLFTSDDFSVGAILLKKLWVPKSCHEWRNWILRIYIKPSRWDHRSFFCCWFLVLDCEMLNASRNQKRVTQQIIIFSSPWLLFYISSIFYWKMWSAKINRNLLKRALIVLTLRIWKKLQIYLSCFNLVDE